MNSTLVSLTIIAGLAVGAWGLAELVKWLAHKIGYSADRRVLGDLRAHADSPFAISSSSLPSLSRSKVV